MLAGPVDLVQGGRGFIARLPVFVDGGDETRRFWGVVSAIIDLDALYRDAGLYDPSLPIDVAIAGRDGGEQDAAASSATRGCSTPSGHALHQRPFRRLDDRRGPERRLGRRLERSLVARLIILLAGVLVVAPAWLAGRLIEERRAHFDRLAEREVELERLSRRLGLALDASKVGVWQFNVDSGELVWDDRMNQLYNYPLRWRDANRRRIGATASTRPTPIARSQNSTAAFHAHAALRIAVSARPRRRAQSG